MRRHSLAASGGAWRGAKSLGLLSYYQKTKGTIGLAIEGYREPFISPGKCGFTWDIGWVFIYPTLTLDSVCQ